ncbi:MAG TPA: hypothetical protein VI451_07835, partial [Anaerolineales bacterium]|nr:hypothetical protein [Anaerolineales bacterium]
MIKTEPKTASSASLLWGTNCGLTVLSMFASYGGKSLILGDKNLTTQPRRGLARKKGAANKYTGSLGIGGEVGI